MLTRTNEDTLPDRASLDRLAPGAGDRPLAVAHRAGNSLRHLRRAQAAGVDLIEADVWLYRGRLEVRHHKTAGPLPVLWDRWDVTVGWSPRFHLAELLQAAGSEARFLLDLKGWDRRLPGRVLALLRELMPERPVAVSSQNWDLLAPFADHEPATLFYSAGKPRQLPGLLDRLGTSGRHGVSIHARLLDPELTRALKERASAVIPWRVNTVGQMRQLLAWGVDGINADDLRLLERLLTGDW